MRRGAPHPTGLSCQNAGVRNFSPRFELGPRLDPQVGPVDKLGGLPVGIAPGLWPRCADCGAAMSHLGQFVHHPDRLDLGAPGRVLTLWQCEADPGGCETWSWESGANAAVVSDGEAGAELPVLPPDPGTVLYPEIRVTGWSGSDDGGSGTRFGGVPAWEQSADEAPPPPWTFVGQLASRQPMRSGPPDLRLDPAWTASGWYLTNVRFGDDGIAYVFLDRSVDPPAARWFWQSG